MLKFDKNQKQALDKKSFNKSAATSSFKKTILANQLDGAFKRFDEEFSFVYEPKKGDFGWHPSGDCLPPVTVLWNKAYTALHPELATAPAKDMSGLTKIFMVGHYWHQIIQYLIVKEGWADASAIEGIGYKGWGESKYGYVRLQWLVDEQNKDSPGKFKPFHYVRGQGDVAPLIMNNWTGLVDIKTMNPSDFKAGLAQSRFAKKYLAQINIYMNLFDLDQAMILAVDKGSSAFAEYTFVRDQKLIDQVFRKWEFVSHCLDHDMIPTEDDDKEYELYIGDE